MHRKSHDHVDDSTLQSESIDNFIKAVYFLQKDIDPVPTNHLAQALDIKAPSVTDMIKRLSIELVAEAGERPALLEYVPYKGVRLTSAGQKLALELIRHHRLLELYLVQKLGYAWDEVHEEAENLEHHISEKLEARIAAALGNPILDPHGDPIPALDGSMANLEQMHLTEMKPGQSSAVTQIVDQSPDVLRYLSGLGLILGAEVMLCARSPLNDTVTLCIGTENHTISTQVAQKVMVAIVTS